MLVQLLLLWSVVLQVCADVFSIIPDNKQVLALDSNDNGIVIITTESITQYTIDHSDNTVIPIGQRALPVSDVKIDDFMVLKLLDSDRTAFCIRSSCWYCSNTMAGYMCWNLNLNAFNRTIEKIGSASIAYRYPKLFLQICYNSAILVFNLEQGSTTMELNYTQAIDLSYNVSISAGAFTQGKSVYFIGKDSFNKIKITRICSTDTSFNLESRLELTLECTTDFDISNIPATFYSTRDKKYEIYVAVLRSASFQTICSFNTKVIDMQFDGIEGGDNCDGRKNVHDSSIYTGKIISKFGYAAQQPKIQQILMDKSSGSLLLSSKPAYGIDSSIYWVANDENPATINHSTPILTHIQSNELSVKQSIGLSEYNLLYINKTSVDYLKISCENLYPTCETFNNGYAAVMDCAWCLDKIVNKAVNRRATCRHRYNRVQYHDTCPKDSTKVNNPSQTTTTLRPTRPSTVHFKSEDVAVTTNSPHSRSVTAIPTTVPDDLITQAKSDNSGEGFTTYLLYVILVVILALMGSIIGLTIRDAKDRRRGDELVSTVSLSADEENTSLIPPPVVIVPPLNDYKSMFMKLNDELKIDATHLKYDDATVSIGKGNFGVVRLAMYNAPNSEPRKVACKTLMKNKGRNRDFFLEGTTMSTFVNKRVIKLIGIAYTADIDNPIIIVSDYMPNGDLLSYIRATERPPPTVQQRILFAIQIAEGMLYLHSKKFIHRDLAARNCMLDSAMEVKIGDFGLARQCNEEGEYLNNYGPGLPYRWTALEAMYSINETCTFHGDVWSFGVVMWEIMSLGAEPYDSQSFTLVRAYLEDDHRLKKPKDCPDELYNKIMLKCWDREMHERPPFAAIVYLLKNYLKKL